MTHYVLLLVESSISENAWIGYHFVAKHEFEHVIPVLPTFENGIVPPFAEVHNLFKNSEFNLVEKWSKESYIGWTVEEFLIAKGGALSCFYFDHNANFLRLQKLFLDVTKVAQVRG